MNLIGAQVKHKMWGEGVVSAQESNILTIDFPAKTSKFQYNEATFTKFLEVINPAVQLAILTEFEEQKRAEELRRQEETQRAAAIPKPVVKTDAKKIEDMFGEDYHVNYLARQSILTYQQVEEQFGIKISGFGKGINPTDSTVVLISSIGKAKGNFVYHDRWTADGDYLYSGEGKTGDQPMTKGNLAIKNAERDGKAMHLFVKLSPQEYYYQGIFKLVDYTYEDEKDEAGNTRKEYKFRLRKC